MTSYTSRSCTGVSGVRRQPATRRRGAILDAIGFIGIGDSASAVVEGLAIASGQAPYAPKRVPDSI